MVQDLAVAAQPSAALAGTAGGQPGPVAAGHAAGRERLSGPGGDGAGGPRGQRPHAAPPAVRRSEGRRGPAGRLGGGPGTGRGGLFRAAAGLGPVLDGLGPVLDGAAGTGGTATAPGAGRGPHPPCGSAGGPDGQRGPRPHGHPGGLASGARPGVALLDGPPVPSAGTPGPGGAAGDGGPCAVRPGAVQFPALAPDPVPGLASLPALRPRADLLARGAGDGSTGGGLGWGRGHAVGGPRGGLAPPPSPAGHAGGAPRAGA